MKRRGDDHRNLEKAKAASASRQTTTRSEQTATTTKAQAAPEIEGGGWVPLAQRARDAIDAAPNGHKIEALERLAAEHKISRDSLRRAVAAARLLEAMRAKGVCVPEEVNMVPVGVVDIIARWAGYDEAAAFAAVRQYHRGDLPFRELMRAESAARPKGRTRRGPRRMDVVRAWKEACLDRTGAIMRVAELELLEQAIDDLPVDAWARGHDRSTAIMIVGPHADTTRYEAEIEAVILRALGIAHLGYDVWIVVPGSQLAKGYEAWLDRRSISPVSLRIVGLRRPPRLEQFV